MGGHESAITGSFHRRGWQHLCSRQMMMADFRLPRAEIRAANPATTSTTADARYHVLVVDDIAGNRQLIAACRSHDDCRVSFASSASAALEAVKTQQPDLVLMDVVMPGISGIEACRLMKQNPASRLACTMPS